MFKEDIARYKREGSKLIHEPAIIIIFLYRLRRKMMKLPFIIKLFPSLLIEPVYFLFTILLGIHLPKSCEIGPGLIIHHFGGIILNSNTVIGKNCTLRHNVTIGNRSEIDDVPIIGDNVNIGVGAVLIGRIRIGNNVNIGANAVVLKDVPDNSTAVGVPANILYKKRSSKTNNNE